MFEINNVYKFLIYRLNCNLDSEAISIDLKDDIIKNCENY